MHEARDNARKNGKKENKEKQEKPSRPPSPIRSPGPFLRLSENCGRTRVATLVEENKNGERLWREIQGKGGKSRRAGK